ncbi:endocuticle structural glycoprotein SgAbd-5-like isoform X2 [Pectinophora gossypiella]|uniref:endocuticle structural glycoprotein SgAbd-5-like isoform X2 n=1 Tax=Pectinophora gossypiella TaxID=13191 RepID=UPI00214E750D|nr:endocuticle structural glycoprotein SgAbd-5-like isoform X2 [Pectinophora gossypiella]
MKLLVVLGLVAVVAAAPQGANPNQDIQLIRLESDNDGLGTYSYTYEQSDGNKRNEQGELKNAGTDDEGIVMRGSYSWVGPDGITYTVNYIADENGFQPQIEQGRGDAAPPGVVASILG